MPWSAKQTSLGRTRAVDRNFTAEALGQILDRLNGIAIGNHAVVDGPNIQRKVEPFLGDVRANDHGRAHGFGQQARGHAHRADAGDQHTVFAGNLHTLQRLVGRAETTGNQRAVDEAQLVGQRHTDTLLSDAVVGVAAVALPAVGGALGRSAGDHVAFTAVMTDATAADVVEDDAVALFEALDAGTDLDDLPARLVATDHALIGLGTMTQMFTIDSTDVAAADG